MTLTQIDETGGRPVDDGHSKRFVTSTAERPDHSSAGDGPRAGGDSLMSRRAAVSGLAMGVTALLCFVLSAGFSDGPAQVSEASAQRVFDLREQIKVAQIQTEALPEPQDADRGLVTAQASADQIAKLQNDYRHLTPDVAAGGGEIDEAATLSIRRNLTPYFTPSVDQVVLEPWYLLASDKDVPDAIGIPMSFDSGFRWVAQRPYLINKDSTVQVTWLAIETHPAAGQPAAVLAWARADYNMIRKTFSNVETGTTTTGEALHQEVKTS